MKNAFCDGIADFSGIVKKEDTQNGLYISKVKICLNIDKLITISL